MNHLIDKEFFVSMASGSGVVVKNEVGERLEIDVETVAKSAILQEFCIVWPLLFLKLLNVKI